MYNIVKKILLNSNKNVPHPKINLRNSVTLRIFIFNIFPSLHNLIMK